MKACRAGIVSLVCYLLSMPIMAQVNNPQEKAKRMQWWTDARFGMFLHWGAYSVLGGEWNGVDYGKEMADASSEWIYLTADIPKADYEQVAKSFNPAKFDADKWVKMAKDAGMKYMVLTSKHHDGFALFDSKATNWNVVKTAAYHQDVVKKFTDACRKQDMKVGLYFSHEKDWYNSKKIRNDYTPNTPEYLQLVKEQLTEVLTNYGKIDLLWFDMGIENHQQLNEMCYKLVRKLQPDCIISSRIGSGLGDYKNLGDRELALPGMGDYVESIMTLRLNWAYDKNDAEWKSSDDVIAMISKTACRGSNFLLNIGPQPDGDFTPEEKIRLKNIGDWMKQNGEAIYNTKKSPFVGEFSWGSITYNDKIVYLHLNGTLLPQAILTGLKSKINSATLLKDGTAVAFTQNITDASVTLHLPSNIAAFKAPIIKLVLADLPTFVQDKGPTKLPPVEKYNRRKLIKGVITVVDGINFTLRSQDTTMNFQLNESMEYRIKQNNITQQVRGYNLQPNQSCSVVYEADTRKRVTLILRED
ncbi:alpha-L-fucosidase [Pedobacter sp. MW01-1-1]|uniref:alpha-L-fucosidase n=1 Tax=Pedobacter sp. MW01-1-1 TaxID=3383027 RepID=UPI003FEE2247